MMRILAFVSFINGYIAKEQVVCYAAQLFFSVRQEDFERTDELRELLEGGRKRWTGICGIQLSRAIVSSACGTID